MAGDEETALWDRLETRDYAEEGIPVILVVETVGGASPPPSSEPELPQLFLAVAARLRGRRDVTPARVIELLAARELDALPSG